MKQYRAKSSQCIQIDAYVYTDILCGGKERIYTMVKTSGMKMTNISQHHIGGSDPKYKIEHSRDITINYFYCV